MTGAANDGSAPAHDVFMANGRLISIRAAVKNRPELALNFAEYIETIANQDDPVGSVILGLSSFAAEAWRESERRPHTRVLAQYLDEVVRQLKRVNSPEEFAALLNQVLG